MTEPNKSLEQMTAQERLDLGMSYFEEGRFDKAIKTWSEIRHDDDPKVYALAQLILGVAYAKSGKSDEAITAWSNITHDDDPGAYARAQLNLGAAYNESGKLDDAITAWKKVREDDPETYAWAQFSLGAAYYAQGKAQLNLGNTYKAQGKLDDAITAWSNIHRDDNLKTYAKAQLNLGEVYSLDKEKEEQSYEAYNNAQEFSYYKPERGFKILKCPQKIRKDLHTLAESTDEVLESLQIIPGFESQVAHYSRASTAFTLFGDKRKKQEPSHFRLSTIRGVNDPTEGLVLGKYWAQQGISETIHTNDTATFISCFTFNHDSLNQFRLYGKEDGQEATGVSLVFKKEFFRNQSDTLEFIAAPSIDPSSNSVQDSSKEKEKPQSNNNKELIGKSTLYRCIYLDPETGYWTLAQRDKSTFYRQYKGEAKEKWEKYYESIPKKEEIVEKYLFTEDGEDNKNNSVLSILKSISKELEESNAPEESHTYSIEEKQKILEAIRFILLPLQYLVKHIAFQEEQECRIMYITQFRDEKIHSDREKQWMYVEYEEPVLPHIDKIWLSPGATKDQDFFRILLDQGSGKSKVRISQNPFRNKE